MIAQLALFAGLYVASLLVLVFLFINAPNDFEGLTLENLEAVQKRAVLKFMYNSFLTRLSMYHEALIGCIFGVFVFLALLTSFDLPVYIRLILLWLGIAAVGLTILILAYTLVFYGALNVIEKAYEIDGKESKTIQEYLEETNIKALTVLKIFPIIGWIRGGWTRGGPKLMIFILATFWLVFLLPIICVMVMLSFPL